jgi:hypothetical protein
MPAARPLAASLQAKVAARAYTRPSVARAAMLTPMSESGEQDERKVA